jgi:hypothetical protein
MKSHGALHDGCAYSVVDCDWGNRCMPRDRCEGGRVVFRHRWHQGGHHHLQPGDLTERRPNRERPSDASPIPVEAGPILVEPIPPAVRWTLLADDPE